MTALHVVELDAADTHALRRAVLRRGTPTDDVDFTEDHWPGVVHLGVRVGDELVATSTWIPRPFDGPEGVEASAVQLRGMATATHLQSTGVGGLLVEEGCERMHREGHTLVWARARDAALVFYVRHGFEVRGDGFIDTTTGLPHHIVTRRLR